MNMIVAAVLAIVSTIIIVWGGAIAILILTKFITWNDVVDAFTIDLPNFFRR